MPHLTVEYTGNLPDFTPRSLLKALNQVLIDSGEFDTPSIKSRAICLHDYLVGDQADGQAFIHVHLNLLDGRSHATKQQLSARLLAVLDASVAASAGLTLQRCVEIRDVHRASYAKSCSQP